MRSKDARKLPLFARICRLYIFTHLPRKTKRLAATLLLKAFVLLPPKKYRPTEKVRRHRQAFETIYTPRE
jgi:hypothetical protein